MLTKNDLMLFEILDEFVDKTLGFGCFVILHENAETMKFLKEQDDNNYRCVQLVKKFPHYSNENPKDHRTVMFPNSSSIQNYRTDWVEKESYIVGHYPTLSTVLRYLNSKIDEISFSENYAIFFYGSDLFSFDITEELKDWSEEKKEELILFLKSL